MHAAAKPQIIIDDVDDEMKTANSLVKSTSKTVFSAGYNIRRWIIGYERDSYWRSNIFYIGPFYFTRRPRV